MTVATTQSSASVAADADVLLSIANFASIAESISGNELAQRYGRMPVLVLLALVTGWILGGDAPVGRGDNDVGMPNMFSVRCCDRRRSLQAGGDRLA